MLFSELDKGAVVVVYEAERREWCWISCRWCFDTLYVEMHQNQGKTISSRVKNDLIGELTLFTFETHLKFTSECWTHGNLLASGIWYFIHSKISLELWDFESQRKMTLNYFGWMHSYLFISFWNDKLCSLLFAFFKAQISYFVDCRNTSLNWI